MTQPEVLIVDDDNIFLFLARKMIVNTGIHPDPKAFPNGKLALEYLSQVDPSGPKVLVFLDINMPVLNGWGFLERLESMEIRGNCHVVIVTSSSDASDRVHAAQYDIVQSYLEKPVIRRVFEDLKQEPFMSDFLEY
jgi:CheY-like chemotaxis protein